MTTPPIRWESPAMRHSVNGPAVERMAEQLARDLAGLRCPVHGKAPDVVVLGSTPGALNVEAETCCTELQDLVARRAK